MNTSAPSTGPSRALSIGNDAFSSEENILAALVTVRNSALAPQEKAALRDLFLDFAGEDDTDRRQILKETIERRLASNRLNPPPAPPTKKVETSVSAEPGIGSSRPQPAFALQVAKAPSAETPPAPNKITKPEPTPVKVAVAPTPIKINRPAPPPTPEVVKESVPPPTVTPSPTPKSVAAPSPEPTPVVMMTPAINPKARIDEIKHDVNKRVGNPVNLINTDPTIGRNYMSALLDAMKRSSGGELDARDALAKLEQAYAAVNELLKTTPVKSSSPVAPRSVAEVTKTSPSTPPVRPMEPAPVVKETVQTPVSAPSSKREGLYHRPLDSTADQKNKAPILEALSSKLPRPEVTPNKRGAFVQLASNPKQTPTLRKVPVASGESPANKEEAAVKPQEPEAPRTLSSVSTATALPDQIAKLKQAAAERERLDNEPITDLMAEKVTAGLNQLLAEWSLFKGKGWFGSGPSGAAHPLYKQLADLPMAAVVAGRFEGVNPEIRQSLTDYMNGWRYEQGIVHDMGETFEHYLRRVILHILERQHDPMKPQKKP